LSSNCRRRRQRRRRSAELNKQLFKASEADAVIQTFALAAGAIDEAAYAAWLKANTRRARSNKNS
jgi:hypothetical protein